MKYKYCLFDFDGTIADTGEGIRKSVAWSAEKLGYGQSYIYPHDHGGYVKQQYLPDDLEREGIRYYRPSENGAEAGFKKFLEDLEKRYGNHQG